MNSCQTWGLIAEQKQRFKLNSLDAAGATNISSNHEMMRFGQNSSPLSDQIGGQAGAHKSIDMQKANSHPKVMPTEPTNLFLEGNFAPLREEITLTKPQNFEIRGKIPRDLNGSFYRNGPNPQFEPGPFYHWFLGDGMVHAFHLQRGEVSYRNRYVVTPTFELERRARKNLFLGQRTNFLANLQLVGGNLFSLLSGFIRDKNADTYTRLIAKANTSVLAFREEVFALVESSPPVRLQPTTLGSEGFEKFDAGFMAPFTAHPKIDPHTGYLYAFGYRVAGSPRLEYYVINPHGKLVSRTAVETDYTAMIHDFVITRNYAVVPVFPAVASLASIRKGRIAEWKPEQGASVIVLGKDGAASSLRRFTLPVGYVYHYANAFEDGKNIVIDAIRYDQVPLMGSDADIRAELFEQSNNGYLTRFRIDLQSGQIETQQLNAERYAEFPVIDPRLVGEKYDHSYAACASGKSASTAGIFDSQVSYEHTRGKVKAEFHDFPKGHFGGEPIYVATGKPGQRKGYLLNLIYAGAEERSYLAIFDAARPEKRPLCEIWLPHRVPYGFHGTWRQHRS